MEALKIASRGFNPTMVDEGQVGNRAGEIERPGFNPTMVDEGLISPFLSLCISLECQSHHGRRGTGG